MTKSHTGSQRSTVKIPQLNLDIMPKIFEMNEHTDATIKKTKQSKIVKSKKPNRIFSSETDPFGYLKLYLNSNVAAQNKPKSR